MKKKKLKKKSKAELAPLILALEDLIETGQLMIAYAVPGKKNTYDGDYATCVCLNGSVLQIDSIVRSAKNGAK